jgi:DNA-binding MarR family transcriptional regulator
MSSQGTSFVVAKATKVNIISNATSLDHSMTPDDFHLSSFLPYRLAVLSERVSRRLSVEYGRTHGLAVAEWRVMVHLLRCGAVSVRDIHNCVNLEKPRVSRAVSRLEAEGLVEKTQGEGDGRLVAISLTDAGRRALADIIPAATQIEGHLTGAVSPEDLATFFRVMERMHAVLDDDPEAKPRTVMDLDRDAKIMPSPV